jgi:hypothetical protein
MPRMLETYGGVALLIGASTIVGQAVFVLAGRARWSWSAAAVGLAALIVLSSIAIRLPGRDVTATVVCLIALALATIVVWRHSGFGWPWRGVAVAVPAVLGASLPFLANHRVGIPGVGLDNDMSVHLLWAEGLRSTSIASQYPLQNGYPVGPHSLAATLASSIGIRLDYAFTALLVVIVPVTALAAVCVVPRAAIWRKALIGLMTSLAYLAAAYYVQGSFKETMMALFLLAFVLILRELSSEKPRTLSAAGWARLGIPAGILAAASVYAYSYLALAWLGGFLALWLVAELLIPPSPILSRTRGRRWLARVVPVAFGGCVTCLVAILPSLQRLLNYLQAVGSSAGGAGIPTSNVGNLAGPLSPYEGLGAWLSPDYRFPSPQTFHAGELGALALAVLIFGVLWALRRRDLALPAAVGICVLIYVYSRGHQSPYVTAKALVIAAPMVMVVGARALLSGREDSWAGSPASIVRLFAGLAFAFVALHSSSMVLRGEPIGSTAQLVELDQMRSIVGGAPALFLGNDDFAGWELRGAQLAYPSVTAFPAPLHVSLSAKPYSYGNPFDFDSIDGTQLNDFTYVITTRSPYASQPPANFHLVKTLSLYTLWKRSGLTPRRRSLDTGETPGAILNCRTPEGTRLSHTPGVAAIMTPPVLSGGVGTLGPNSHLTTTLRLPQGMWDLSLEYTGEEVLKLAAEHGRWELPANTARPGPYFYFGTVHSDGRKPVQVQIYETHPSRLTSSIALANLSNVAATRYPDSRTIVPLARACGRYVDWYRLGRGKR